MLAQDEEIDMKDTNHTGVIRQVASLVGVIGAGVLMSLPVAAETMNCNASASSQVSYTAATGTTLDVVADGDKGAKKPQAKKNIAEIASTNNNFKMMTAVLKAAGLTQTLAGKGPFTVFAPTDAAFAKLPKGTVENLLKPENREKLVKIMTYHVVLGKVTSAQIKSGEVKTVEGSAVKLNVTNRKVMVNNATVIMPDVQASNGVIHAIDTVIMPAD